MQAGALADRHTDANADPNADTNRFADRHAPSSRALRGRLQPRNERPTAMMTKQTIQGYVKAEPFRAFRLHLMSGRTFDIRHPEMIKVLQSTILVFKAAGDAQDLSDEWETVSLMLIESISHLDVPVH